MSIPSSTDGVRVRDRDAQRMERALALAAEGVGLAHPNPIVGAVIEKNEVIVGEGFHQYDLRDHAEVVALRVAGEQARGATMYVTLEPCCYTGRTGPCTKAIIAAGISRVVVAMLDPNPRVAGNGVAELRKAGLHVTVGVLLESARRANADFAKWILTGRPFVMLKSALTLDGQIAARRGAAAPISNEASRESVQILRHGADAILTGVGTVLADDPLLTDRSGRRRRRKLLRVVADSRLCTPVRSKLVASADGDLLVATTAALTTSKARVLARAGVEVIRVKAKRGRVDLQALLAELGRREILNVLLEAGSAMNGAALAAGVVDKMILYYAPRIMGMGGVPFAGVSSKDVARLRLASLEDVRLSQYGGDFCVEGTLHNVYGDHRARRKN